MNRSGWSRSAGRIVAVVAAAVLGAGLIAVPSLVLEYYDTARRLGGIAGYVYLACVGAGAVTLLLVAGTVGHGIWRNTRDKRRRIEREKLNPSEMSAPAIEQEIAEHQTQLAELTSDEAIPQPVREQIQSLAQRLDEKKTTQALEIVAFGTISSGKSSLLNALAGEKLFATAARGGTTITRQEVAWRDYDRATLVDTPGIGEASDTEHGRIAREAARDADLILFVIEGPLRASEISLLRLLAGMEKRILVCLNKSDWYSEDDRKELLDQVRAQVSPHVEPADVVWVRASATTQTRIRVAPDGTQRKETYELEPDISALADQMLRVLERGGKRLLLANLLLRSRALMADSRSMAQAALDQQAMRIVEKHTWGGAAAAAILPGMGTDIAVALTVGVKMTNDLAKVYRQKIDAAAVARLVEELPKQLLAVMGVHALTPAVSAAVASGLKMVPGVGTIAGGAMQGLTQAVLIQWMGRVFIAYFRSGMQPTGGLAMLAREKWDEVTSRESMTRLVRVGLGKLVAREQARK